MNNDTIVNKVRSYSSGVEGRSINNVGTHHFVIDEPTYNGGPGEEVTPTDVFLSGVSACGVLLVQKFARESNTRLDRVAATIEGVRKSSDPSRFESVHIRFDMKGPSKHQAEQLVERYKGR